jgi:hypothetical protein
MKIAKRLLALIVGVVSCALLMQMTNLYASSAPTGLVSALPKRDGTNLVGRGEERSAVMEQAEAGPLRGRACVDGGGHPMTYPLSPLELELRRLAEITAKVMTEINATYWPADGTLLGVMRNGRVATDRDLDFQIHSTIKDCFAFLASLRPYFAKYGRIKSFDVKKKKHNGVKIGRYAMVRMFREHGTFDTGPDFNCVYMDAPEGPSFFTHKGVFTPLPSGVLPLRKCLLYDQEIACPGDGMAFLKTLRPRYDGCMVFPHCFGAATHSSRKCLSPHPVFPLASFVEATRQVGKCGYVSLAAHFEDEPECARLLQRAPPPGEDATIGMQCDQVAGEKICFLQRFID